MHEIMNGATYANPISVQLENDEVEKFSFTLKRGLMNEQQLQVLLEFFLVCNPPQALKIMHNMGLVFSKSDEIQEMDDRQRAALSDVLNLFTGLWEAEHRQHIPLDLNFFG